MQVKVVHMFLAWHGRRLDSVAYFGVYHFFWQQLRCDFFGLVSTTILFVD